MKVAALAGDVVNSNPYRIAHRKLRDMAPNNGMPKIESRTLVIGVAIATTSPAVTRLTWFCVTRSSLQR